MIFRRQGWIFCTSTVHSSYELSLISNKSQIKRSHMLHTHPSPVSAQCVYGPTDLPVCRHMGFNGYFLQHREFHRWFNHFMMLKSCRVHNIPHNPNDSVIFWYIKGLNEALGSQLVLKCSIKRVKLKSEKQLQTLCEHKTTTACSGFFI